MKTLLVMTLVSGSSVAFAQPAAAPPATPVAAPAATPVAAPVTPVTAPPVTPVTAPPVAAPPATPVTAPPATPVTAPAATPVAASSATAQSTTALAAAAPAPTAGPGLVVPGFVVPGFVVIDKIDASSRAGIQLSYVGLQGDAPDKPTLLRVAAHVRYVDKATGLGGYVQVPFSYASAVGDSMSDSTTDLGNIEIGGIFAPKLDVPGIGLVLHAGVTLPTGESGDAAVVGTLESFLALPDLYNSLPRGTTIKLGVSPTFRRGIVFARLDLGLDWNVDAKDAVIGKGIHYNAGVGLDFGPAAVMLESENLSIMDQSNTTTGTQSSGVTLNALAFSARLTRGAVSPYIAVVIPLDEDISDSFTFAATAGADLRIP